MLKDRFNLDGKVAIVTGATAGIGAATAMGLAEFGAQVVVSSRRAESVTAVAAELETRGLKAVGIAAHMGRREDIARLVSEVEARFGRIDIIVNNAVTNPVFGPMQDVDHGAFDKIVDVNLRGPLELCRLAYPIMVRHGGGSIINVSSVGGISPEDGLSIYSMSKAALNSLTKAMAKEWGVKGIRANVVCPGLIKTKFSTALWNDDRIRDEILQRVPLKRIGAAEEVVGLIVFLASDAASYCTGGIYTVDGGVTA